MNTPAVVPSRLFHKLTINLIPQRPVSQTLTQYPPLLLQYRRGRSTNKRRRRAVMGRLVHDFLDRLEDPHGFFVEGFIRELKERAAERSLVVGNWSGEHGEQSKGVAPFAMSSSAKQGPSSGK